MREPRPIFCILVATGLIGFLCLLTGCAPPTPRTGRSNPTGTPARASGKLLVYVPDLIARPSVEAMEGFKKAHPEVAASFVKGEELELRDRVAKGETPDVLLSVGIRETMPLDKKKRTVPGSYSQFAVAPLIVITPLHNPARVKRAEDLASPRVRRIAMADPQTVSAGQAAKQSLEKLKLWDKVRAKVVQCASVEEVRQEVELGKVDTGITCEGCPGRHREEEPCRIAAAFEFGEGTHEEVPVGGFIIRGAKNPVAGRELLKVLASDDGQAAFQRWGFKAVRKGSAKGASLFVHCAAGLRLPMDDIAAIFEKKHGVKVRYNYTGSACLLAQITLTEQGDIYVPGEEFYMEQARKRGYLGAGRQLAYFVPVIMVREGNPQKIRTLRDLTRAGLRVGIGEPRSCAVGHTTEELLAKVGLKEAVHKNVVTRTATAPELGNAIKLGSIDAAIEWDAVANWYEDAATIVPIPASENLPVAIPIGVLNFASNKQLAQQFVDFAATEGRKVFAHHHYTLDLKHPVYPVGSEESKR